MVYSLPSFEDVDLYFTQLRLFIMHVICCGLKFEPFCYLICLDYELPNITEIVIG